jgi:hypothetical protein
MQRFWLKAGWARFQGQESIGSKRDEAYSSSSESRWIKVEQADRVTVQKLGSPCLANPVKTGSVKKSSQK